MFFSQKELVHLFSEVGSVQDVHLQPQRDGSYTYGLVLVCVLVISYKFFQS